MCGPDLPKRELKLRIHGMAGHLIRRLNQLSTHVFAKRIQAAGYDLTPVQFAAMDAIATHPGIDQAGIAAKIAYDRATIGGVIDRLEHKGYVTRCVSQQDRRAREVRLTEEGGTVYREALPVVSQLQEDILPGLSKSERQTLLKLAAKVVGVDGDTV